MSKEIPIFKDLSIEEFDSLIEKDFPFIIHQADFGECHRKWNLEYLCKQLKDIQVVIHKSDQAKLDFLSKNFKYNLMKFDDFLKKCSKESNDDDSFYYLRSIGGDQHGKIIADISKDFPQICQDIEFPDFLNMCQYPKEKRNKKDDQEVICQDDCCLKKHLFSSVLRISSKQLTIWTHYDVMDNVLVQIKGRKRVILFPPTDAQYLYLKGDKSQILDLDLDIEILQKKFPLFSNTTRYECILEEGDSLFIPSMWFHNTIALDFSLGMNFFWKNSKISNEFYDPTDVYGNKDLIPATSAYANLDKAIKHLNRLPEKFKKFYLSMLIAKLNKELYQFC